MRFLAFLALAFLLAPLAVPKSSLSGTARASDDPATTLGTFKPTGGPANFGSGAALYVDPGARVLYVYDVGVNWVAAYDADTFRPLGVGMSTGTDAVTSVYPDEVGSGLLMARAGLDGSSRIEEYVSTAAGVRLAGSIDMSKSTPPLPPGDLVLGLYRAPASNKLWVLAGTGYSASAETGGVAVAQLTLQGPSISTAKVDWVQPLPGCPQVMHFFSSIDSAIGYYAPTHSLYFGCSQIGPNGTGLVQTSTPRGAGQLVLNVPGSLNGAVTQGPFHLYTHSGDFSQGNSFFVPSAGRLGMVAYNTASAGSTIFVFDAATSGWVGGMSVSSNQVNQDGLDAVHGRYYALNALTGLVWGDLDSTPTGQGVSLPQYSQRQKQSEDNAKPLAVDPVTKRAFLKYTTFPDFLVVRDNTPDFSPAPSDDPDANTTDAEEAPGKTQAAYSAGAQAYGAIVRQVGGWGSTFMNVTGVSDLVLPPLPIGDGTREFRSSYLDDLQLTNDEASAQAITADADSGNSKHDLSGSKPPGPNDVPPSVSSATSSTTSTTVPPQVQPIDDQVNNPQPLVNWPYNAAQCTDFGDKPADVSVDSSVATCHAAEHWGHAQTSYGQSQANGVTVANTSMDAKTYLDKALGSVAEVHVESRGISVLGDALKIGEVIVDAKSWARGRPGTANSTYTSHVKNVFMNGQELCSDQCDPQKVQDQVNNALGQQGVSPSATVKISFPVIDPTYYHGSKRGYQAIVQADQAFHLEDVIVNEQSQDRLEVPGMVILLSQDNLKPGRTIVLLSGVETEAHYGISLLDDYGFGTDVSPAGDGGGGGIADSLGGSLLGGGSGSTGLAGGDDLNGIGSPAGGGLVGRTGRLIMNGLRRMGALLPIWALLLVPIYLSARRWLLLQRSTLIGGRS